MHQPRKSIARHALFALSVVAISAATARAQPARTGSVAELSYRAPASCPSRAAFEQRLRLRLGASPGTRLPVALSISLSLNGAQAIGEIAVTSGPRSGARRSVTAASCDEAVDALTLVTALLIEPQARSEPPRSDAQRAAAAPAGDGGREASTSRSRSPSASAADAGRNAAAAPSPGPRASTANENAASVDTAGAPDAERREREGEQPSEGQRAKEQPNERAAERAPLAAQATREREAPAQGAANAAEGAAIRADDESGLQLDVAVAALLVVGTLPAPRPGLLGRLALALPLSRAWAVALELSGRGLLPQRERGPEGDARFRFYAGGAGLCARRGGERLATSACAQAELGQLAAQGENTSNPQRARTLWSAVGAGARAALTLASPLALHAGLELLFPTSRDRFEVGPTALFVVPRLTFRMELGLGVHFE